MLSYVKNTCSPVTAAGSFYISPTFTIKTSVLFSPSSSSKDVTVLVLQLNAFKPETCVKVVERVFSQDP